MSKLSDFLFVKHRHNWWLLFKFGLVGGSGVLVNMLVAVVMHKLNGGQQNYQNIIWAVPGTPYNVRFWLLVWVVGFVIACLTNFQMNRTWTFQSAKHAGWWKEFWPFFAVGAVAAIVGAFIKMALVHPNSPFLLPPSIFHGKEGFFAPDYWAQFIAILLTMPINFVVNKLWTFAAVRHRHAEDVPMVAPVVAPEVVDDSESHLGEVLDAPPVDVRGGHESSDVPEAKG